ncbi:MAG: hypothetical protein M5R36_21870 [Deltaproteobacteria bacterium]|nr:hypothetical protein [Deltaproteobacteria bacterium]
MKRFSYALALMAALSAGCAATSLNASVTALRRDLAAIDADRALVCAPRELASARAHLEFAEDDCGTRRYLSCENDVRQAREDIAKIREYLERCGAGDD